MKSVSKDTNRWFCVIPMNYNEGEGFWDRDGGLVCRGFRMSGVDSKFVALGKPGVRDDIPLITCTLEQMKDAAWWAQWDVKAVLLNSWALPRYEPIARAIKKAGIKIVLTLDTDGLVTPHVDPWRYLQEKYFNQKENGKRFPAGWALLKTAAGSIRTRQAGTLRHVEHADLIVLPSPLAKQCYRRYLLAMKRADLIPRLRFVPYAVVKEMTHEAATPKKPMIIAVGRWQSPLKNAPLLMRLLERVLSEQPGWSARVIGGGSEIVKELARHLNADCRSRIDIVGRVDHGKLPAFYRESRIFVCTSRYESFSISAAEALCCGCTLVADVRLTSMPYLTSLGSGTLSCDSSLDHLGDAVMTEMEAWERGRRDPFQISQAWQQRLHADRVAERFLNLFE